MIKAGLLGKGRRVMVTGVAPFPGPARDPTLKGRTRTSSSLGMAARPDPTLTAAPVAARPFRVRLRLDFGGARLGPGKIDLLEAVGRTGSISAAGRAMGMSYRRAWLLVDAVNQMFDEPVVTAAAGGPHGGGAVLTPFGERLVRAFRALEEETAAATTAALGSFFAHLAPAAPAGD